MNPFIQTFAKLSTCFHAMSRLAHQTHALDDTRLAQLGWQFEQHCAGLCQHLFEKNPFDPRSFNPLPLLAILLDPTDGHPDTRKYQQTQEQAIEAALLQMGQHLTDAMHVPFDTQTMPPDALKSINITRMQANHLAFNKAGKLPMYQMHVPAGQLGNFIVNLQFSMMFHPVLKTSVPMPSLSVKVDPNTDYLREQLGLDTNLAQLTDYLIFTSQTRFNANHQQPTLLIEQAARISSTNDSQHKDFYHHCQFSRTIFDQSIQNLAPAQKTDPLFAAPSAPFDFSPHHPSNHATQAQSPYGNSSNTISNTTDKPTANTARFCFDSLQMTFTNDESSMGDLNYPGWHYLQQQTMQKYSNLSYQTPIYVSFFHHQMMQNALNNALQTIESFNSPEQVKHFSFGHIFNQFICTQAFDPKNKFTHGPSLPLGTPYSGHYTLDDLYSYATDSFDYHDSDEEDEFTNDMSSFFNHFNLENEDFTSYKPQIKSVMDFLKLKKHLLTQAAPSADTLLSTKTTDGTSQVQRPSGMNTL